MPRFAGSVTLSTTPQPLVPPSPRAYAALGVANVGNLTAVVQIGSEQWPVNGGFRQIIPLPVSTYPITASCVGGTTTVEISWYSSEDLASIDGLRSNLPQSTTGTLTSAQSLGTVTVSSIEQPVSLVDGQSSSSPLYVTPVPAASEAPTSLQVVGGTITTASTWQLVAGPITSLQTLVVTAPPSTVTSPTPLQVGLTTTDSAPSVTAATVPYQDTRSIEFPFGLGDVPVYVWIQGGVADQPFGVTYAGV